MTTLSFSVTAQEKAAAQNVRFPLYTHNKLWDASLPLVHRIANFAVQIFKEAFKYIANAGLHVANSIYSLFHKHEVVAVEATAITPKVEENIVADDTTIDMNGEVDLDEGIPAEEQQKSWLSLALKITGSVGIACLGVFLANKYNLIPNNITNFFRTNNITNVTEAANSISSIKNL